MIEYMKKHDEEYEEPHDYKKNSANIKDGASGGFAFNPSAVAGGGVGLGTGEQNPDIKAHHLLVLLLRLRQICCHPGLIKTMIDTEARVNDGLADTKEDDDLIAQMGGMAIGGGGRSKQKEELDPEEEMAKKSDVLSPDNPMFQDTTVSSKITTLVQELQ